MIKRRFYRAERGDKDGSSGSSSDSDVEVRSSDDSDQDEPTHPEPEPDSNVEADNDADNDDNDEDDDDVLPLSKTQHPSSSSSGLLANDDDSESEKDGDQLNENLFSRKESGEIIETQTGDDSAVDDLPKCVLKSKSVFKCRLCPKIVCLNEESLKTHLKSKRHSRSEKLLNGGRLKRYLNSDGEEEVLSDDDCETHAERHARIIALSQEERGKGKTPAIFPRAARKSLRVSQSGILDDSGSQHTKSQRVNASVRRSDRSTLQIRTPVASSDDEDCSMSSFPADEDQFIVGARSGASGGNDLSSSHPRGTDGRFISTASSDTTHQGDDMSWVFTEPLAGGPRVGSVIPSFLGHVACPMWTDRQYRGTLKYHVRCGVCLRLTSWFQALSPDSRRQIEDTGLSHLPGMMYKHIDMQLISAFVERWQPDTNTFHMPFGEMTITLHDVWEILRIPVDGEMVSAQSSTPALRADIAELLMANDAEMGSHWLGGGVMIDSIVSRCSSDGIVEDTQVIAWMFLMFGATLFVDKSGNRIRPSCLLEVKDGLDGVSRYSWGSATLAHLYRQLGVATRGDSSDIAGCLTLLQAWIYEYFPCFRPQRERHVLRPGMPRASTWHIVSQGRDDGRLHALRLRIDQLTASEVVWLPYRPDPVTAVRRTTFMGWVRYRDIIEPYMPARVVRQIGYVQTIPPPITRPEKAVRPWTSVRYRVEFPAMTVTDAWSVFPRGYVLPVAEYESAVADPARCDEDYLLWFYRHSRPRLVYIDVTPVIPPRSNTDYWVDRSVRRERNWMSRMEQFDPTAVAEWMQELEEYIRDWSLSR